MIKYLFPFFPSSYTSKYINDKQKIVIGLVNQKYETGLCENS